MNHKDLDIVLNAINHNEAEPEEAISIVKRIIESGIDFKKYLIIEDDDKDPTGFTGNAKPIYLLLFKLAEDDYIDRTPIDYDGHPKFRINFNGIEFLAQGGYTEKVKQEKLNTEKLQKENHLRLIVGVGSVIVGFYYFLLLMKEFVVPLFCNHH